MTKSSCVRLRAGGPSVGTKGGVISSVSVVVGVVETWGKRNWVWSWVAFLVGLLLPSLEGEHHEARRF